MENLHPTLLGRLLPEFRQVLEQSEPGSRSDRIREILARHQFYINLTVAEVIDLADFFGQKLDLRPIIELFSEATLQRPQLNS
jgi:hypothetical protein